LEAVAIGAIVRAIACATDAEASAVHQCGRCLRHPADPAGAARRSGRRPRGGGIHRLVADSISPEQAVDEAITRIKQILSE
jgi:hypothetical protein